VLIMKARKLSQQSRNSHQHPATSDCQPITLDHEVLALEPRLSYWEEGGIESEWECIERRGNRKPSLDDYDRCPLQGCSLAGDGIRSNYFNWMVRL
jgi:hypothetical protein